MPKVLLVLTDNMIATSLTLPMDILASANQAARRWDPNLEPFSCQTIAIEQRRHKSHSGLNFSPDITLEEVAKADIVYLPSFWRNPRTISRMNQALLPWLRRQYEQGSLITGVGTGCCLMAEAGLLDHKPATTHWYYFEQFAKQFPQVLLKRQHFITQAGNLYCAASVNSIADLTIHFVQRYLNRDVAQHIQRHFSQEVRKDYEAVSFLEESNSNHPDEEILQLQLWLKNNIDKNTSLEAMANYADMSTRNLNRRFKQATGRTPQQYLQSLRLKTARDLLQSSNLGIGDIADRVGYNDVSHFTRVFRHNFSTTPGEFRLSVRAKLFSLPKD